MKIFPELRRLGIILTLSGTLLVLARTLLTSVPIEPPPVPVKLPGKSPLSGWEIIVAEPDPLMPNVERYRSTHGNQAIDLEIQFIPDFSTHYIRNSLLAMRFLPRGHLPLDAAMHFYVNSRGRVISNLETDKPSEALVDSRQTSPRSGHGIWTEKGRLHLSTIITPAGDTSMVTRRAFRSFYLDHFEMSRIGKWLLGRTKLPDRRCVLVHFSMPEPPPARHEEGLRTLENAWSDWQHAFQPVFPE